VRRLGSTAALVHARAAETDASVVAEYESAGGT
jgi:hypothetical protein